MPRTIDELYESYMDEGVSFGEDVWEFFGRPGGLEREYLDRPDLWSAEYGMYLPAYDPVQVELAERERDLDYQKAADILDLSSKAANRVYATEADTISTGLSTELGKAREVAGGLGLRSGTLESAVEDTLATSSNKVEDLGDRLMIQKDEDRNKYNTSVVDATLDFDKSVRESKEDWYNNVLGIVNKLIEKGAFAGPSTSYEFWSGEKPSENNPEGLCCTATRKGESYVAQCGSRSCRSGCYTCP